MVAVQLLVVGAVGLDESVAVEQLAGHRRDPHVGAAAFAQQVELAAALVDADFLAAGRRGQAAFCFVIGRKGTVRSPWTISM